MDIYGVYTDQQEVALRNEAYKYAMSVSEDELEDAIEAYTKQEAEIEDMVVKDYYTEMFNEEESIHYARILVRVRYLLFYMRRRFVGDEMDEMEDLKKPDESEMDLLVQKMQTLGK